MIPPQKRDFLCNLVCFFSLILTTVLLSQQLHRYIFLFGVCALAFGMMVGTVPTSVPQFILLGNWLLELDFKRKWNELRDNKIFWIISSVFLIHVVGLIHTSDLKAGLDDVRIKMPLMFLAIIFFSTKPLTLKEFHLLLYLFILGCVVNTAWCHIYSFALHKNEVVRSASRYMSHIRLGLYLNVAVCCCIYFIFNITAVLKRSGFVLLIIYFLFSMYALGLASGFANFIILSIVAFSYLILKQNIKLKLLSILLAAAGIFFLCNYISGIYLSQVQLNQTNINQKLDKTPSGRLYFHFDAPTQKENGNLVQVNIQFEELKNEWNRRNPLDTFDYDNKINLDRYQVLMRYLASKGLTKDSVGVWTLDKEDLANVSNNVTNYQMTGWSFLHKRVYELVNEYDEFKNGRPVNGHSLAMRFEFWKAALHIIKHNFIAGVGTGDVQIELNKTYTETKAPLAEEWYKRPHNQFLTITVALGIFGLLIFIFSIVAPLVWLKGSLPVLYWPFFILAIISFLIEDTLETQAGLTFFAFFNVLFISVGYYKKTSSES